MAQRNLDKLFRTNIARNFVKQVQSSGGDCLYSRVLDLLTTPFLTERTERQENIFRNKLLSGQGFCQMMFVSVLIEKVNWTTGTIYDKIDDNTDMSEKTFYVLNRENNVYVCIDNNGGLALNTRANRDRHKVILPWVIITFGSFCIPCQVTN